MYSIFICVVKRHLHLKKDYYLMSQGWITWKIALFFRLYFIKYVRSNPWNKKKTRFIRWNLFRSLAVHNSTIKEFPFAKNFQILLKNVHIWSVLFAFCVCVFFYMRHKANMWLKFYLMAKSFFFRVLSKWS